MSDINSEEKIKSIKPSLITDLRRFRFKKTVKKMNTCKLKLFFIRIINLSINENCFFMSMCFLIIEFYKTNFIFINFVCIVRNFYYELKFLADDDSNMSPEITVRRKAVNRIEDSDSDVGSPTKLANSDSDRGSESNEKQEKIKYLLNLFPKKDSEVQ